MALNKPFSVPSSTNFQWVKPSPLGTAHFSCF
jgi:hypothetical protein